MDKQKLMAFCARLPDAAVDAPFADDDTTFVARHKANRKWFALLYERGEESYVNLKQDPELSFVLRARYRSVLPAWHMNKLHWNTICLSGDVPDAELENLVLDSFTLTAPAARKKRG